MRTWWRWSCLLACSVAFAQQSHHSLRELFGQLAKPQADTTRCRTFTEISYQYLYKDSAKGLDYAARARQTAEKADWPTGIGIAGLAKGMHEVSLGDYPSAASDFDAAKAIFVKYHRTLELARVYNEIGILKANQSKFPEALDAFLRSLSCYERLPETYRHSRGSSYENIATVYNLTGSLGKATENYRKAISIFSGLKGYEMDLSQNIVSLGTVYQKEKKYVAALQQYRLAEPYIMGSGNDFGKAFLHSWLGSALAETGDFRGSITHCSEALALLEKIGDKQLTATTYLNLGHAYLGSAMKNKPEDFPRALSNLHEALSRDLALGNHEELIRVYADLARYYQATGDWRQSLAMRDLYDAHKDSVFNLRNRQSLQNLEDERTIQLRDNQIRVNRLRLESERRQKWLLAFGIAAILSIALLTWRQSRQRQRINSRLKSLNMQLDEANKAKTRLFGILNHDLRTPVSNLISFLHLQKESPDLMDDVSRERMQARTLSSAENLLESMEDILLWSKSQMERFRPASKKVQVADVFADLSRHFSDIRIGLEFYNPEKLSCHTDPDTLKTILRNLIANALAALSGRSDSKVCVSAFRKNDRIFFEVSDNGPGGSAEKFRAVNDASAPIESRSGLGLHLVRDLSALIGAEISVVSHVGQGTTFMLSLGEIA